MKPAHTYRFLWISRRGPVIKRFTSVEAFTGYTVQAREICGSKAVEWRTPFLAVGVLQ